MARTADFDRQLHARMERREIGISTLLKSLWDEFRKDQDEEAEHDHHGREAEDQGLEAMAHWHDPEPSPYVRHGGRRHLLDDNPCSG